MKKIIFLLAWTMIVILGYNVRASMSQTTNEAIEKSSIKLFYVYSDKGAKDSSFFIPSGWMGDYADLTLQADNTNNPYAGTTCIKITYRNRASSGARWAGIYWQNPASNWGDSEKGGINLTGVTKLTFWARGEKGEERIEEFKMGGLSGPYPDSATANIGPVILTPEWKQYTIDLVGKDLSHVIGGFAWSANLDNNPNGCTFYLDEIRYE